MHILGYKAYNKGLTNIYGEKYEVGKVYTHEGELKFRTCGFHLCENLEDTLRYYDAMNGEVDICEVLGFGNINKNYDSYNDYETIISDHLLIIKKLSRNEIINYALTLSTYRLCRFIQGFRLTEEEINLILNCTTHPDVYKCIRYYQYGEKDVYER